VKLKEIVKLVEGLNKTNLLLNLNNRYYIYLYDNKSNEYRLYKSKDIEKLKYSTDVMSYMLSNDLIYDNYYKIYELYLNENLRITLKIMDY